MIKLPKRKRVLAITSTQPFEPKAISFDADTDFQQQLEIDLSVYGTLFQVGAGWHLYVYGTYDFDEVVALLRELEKTPLS